MEEARYAFVTLLTSDSYLPGALTLAAALRDLHSQSSQPSFELVCIVSPESVDVSTIKLLRRSFDLVVGVELLELESDHGLRLLGRLDLTTVLTKLHAFRLTQFTKIIFLDADILPLRPLSHLFDLPHEFSAVPDVGWPDIFNSGFMVFTPGEQKFSELRDLLKVKGSWDGGDQGILNEWRGDNWHRLSFIYNTTPTAAYTYAPAYERFGSQISAIHFIGSEKPWHSIPFRSPFSQSSSIPSQTTSQSYDYGSLLDRWFSVYDTHFRAQSIVPTQDFEVKRYDSAWNAQLTPQPTSLHTESSAPTFGLDDLRRFAIEGVGVVNPPSHDQPGEGEYRSMPLDGRVDLMRPQPVYPPAQRETGKPHIQPPYYSTDMVAQPSNVKAHGEPFSYQRHEPSTVHAASLSVSPEAPPAIPQIGITVPGPTQISPAIQVSQLSSPQPSIAPFQQHSTQAPPPHTHAVAQRPPSPPMLIWNAAIEPPPSHPPVVDAFPSETYFPNAWDQPHRHEQPYEKGHSGAFFEPPPPPEVPEVLKQQGHYEHIIGRKDHIHDPDRSKVKTIFPWEEKPRHMPGRTFPSGDAPSPSTFIMVEPDAQVEPDVQVEPDTQTPPQEQPQTRRSPEKTFSPPKGLPATLSFANAWDTVPAIKKYASKLVRPTSRTALPPSFVEDGSWRHSGSWAAAARSEASSQDGDVEDEEDEPNIGAPSQLESDEDISSSQSRSRSGSFGSISASYIIKRKRKEYCVRGVQTISPQIRSQGVQTVAPQKQSTESKSASVRKPHIAHVKGQWTPMSANALPPLTVQEGTDPDVELSMATAAPTPNSGSPPKQLSPPSPRSPREFIHVPSPSAGQVLHNAAVAKPTQGVLNEKITRHVSESSTASDPSSIGPLSPPELSPIALPKSSSPVGGRKPGRVFDPARGVDVFKKGSEEVLARFLKMGSWEQGAVVGQ